LKRGKELFDPEIFLEIAKEIRKFKSIDLEGRFRTAIGRSYYAAFLTALEKLRGKGVKFTDDSRIHSDVRDGLYRIKKSNIASKLESLFKIRVDADYKLRSKIDEGKYNSSIRLSENIINLVSKI